jgi:hypothetical protein
MRQVGIIPLGRILIITETNAEQIRTNTVTNTFFVLQRKNVRQNVVCDRASSVVGKPLTTVLVPPSILECSDTRVDENLTDRVLCLSRKE